MQPVSSYIIQGGQSGSDRLDVLANATWPTSESFLEESGLRPGMKLLDVGCGNGEISRRIAKRIGMHGSVFGIDVDAKKIDIAKRKTTAENLHQARFEVRDIREIAQKKTDLDNYDFIYMRFILSHLQDPLALLRGLRTYLNPNGIIAIEDVEFDSHYCVPPCAAFERYVALYIQAAKYRGANANIGPKLTDLMEQAGYMDLTHSSILPVFTNGDGKLMALITMEAISEAVIAAGITSRDEVEKILIGLREFTQDTGSAMSIPRFHQLMGKLVL